MSPDDETGTVRALRHSHVFGEVLSGEGRTGGDKVGGCALEHNPASIMAGSRAEVDDPVGVGHHCLVVFDHNHRLS